jgi:hypothetical protein
MFDISSTAVQDQSDLLLNDAEDAPLFGEDKNKQLSITVYGPGSEVFERAAAKRQNRLMERLKRKGKVDMSAEEQRAEQAEFLSAITISFNGFTWGEGLEGQPMFRGLYMDRKLGFITDQVQRFVGDWGNFSGKSAMS